MKFFSAILFNMPKSKSSKKTHRDIEEDHSSTPKLSPETIERLNKLAYSNQGPNNLLMLLVIVLAVFSTYLFLKIQGLEKNTASTGTNQQVQQQAQQPPQPVKVTMDQIKKLFTKGNITFGDSNRKVLFVEITDPSCPYCHIAAGKNPELSKQAGNFTYVTDGGTYTPPVPEIRKLVDEGKASFVSLFGTGHGNGRLAAEAFYCAYDQGKFWEVHDLLMSNSGYQLLNNNVQNTREKIPDLVNFVAAVVDTEALTSCLTSGKYTTKIADDEKIDQTLGFQGTPHFFVNTTAINGAQDWKSFQPIVQPLIGS